MPAPDVGVLLPSMALPGESPGDVAATARHAEELGFESVWVVDQLVAGTGAPLLHSGIALAVAATATTRVKLGLGVLVLPLRPVAWVAKEIASLQHVSGDRVLLGVGVGGDRHDGSWAAVGVPRRERGARTDAALRVLPGLVAGEPTRLGDEPGDPVVQLAPGATVPPILVGGMSDAAIDRAATYGDGWYGLPVPPAAVAASAARLAEAAAARGRPVPAVTVSTMVALTGDPAVPDHDTLVARLTDPDGPFGIPAEAVASMLVTGGPDEVGEVLAEHAAAGAARVVVSFVAGTWDRQAELLAEARSRID